MLYASMEAASSCALCVRETGADLRIGAVVASMWSHTAAGRIAARPLMEAFGRDCSYAWRVGSDSGLAPESYVFFDIM